MAIVPIGRSSKPTKKTECQTAEREDGAGRRRSRITGARASWAPAPGWQLGPALIVRPGPIGTSYRKSAVTSHDSTKRPGTKVRQIVLIDGKDGGGGLHRGRRTTRSIAKDAEALAKGGADVVVLLEGDGPRGSGIGQYCHRNASSSSTRCLHRVPSIRSRRSWSRLDTLLAEVREQTAIVPRPRGKPSRHGPRSPVRQMANKQGRPMVASTRTWRPTPRRWATRFKPPADPQALSPRTGRPGPTLAKFSMERLKTRKLEAASGSTIAIQKNEELESMEVPGSQGPAGRLPFEEMVYSPATELLRTALERRLRQPLASRGRTPLRGRLLPRAGREGRELKDRGERVVQRSDKDDAGVRLSVCVLNHPDV